MAVGMVKQMVYLNVNLTTFSGIEPKEKVAGHSAITLVQGRVKMSTIKDMQVESILVERGGWVSVGVDESAVKRNLHCVEICNQHCTEIFLVQAYTIYILVTYTVQEYILHGNNASVDTWQLPSASIHHQTVHANNLLLAMSVTQTNTQSKNHRTEPDLHLQAPRVRLSQIHPPQLSQQSVRRYGA